MSKNDDVWGEMTLPPRSKRRLALDGEFSSDNRHPRYIVQVSATVKERVKHKEILIGSSDKYGVAIDVENRNDSQVFMIVKKTTDL